MEQAIPTEADSKAAIKHFYDKDGILGWKLVEFPDETPSRETLASMAEMARGEFFGKMLQLFGFFDLENPKNFVKIMKSFLKPGETLSSGSGKDRTFDMNFTTYEKAFRRRMHHDLLMLEDKTAPVDDLNSELGYKEFRSSVEGIGANLGVSEERIPEKGTIEFLENFKATR